MNITRHVDHEGNELTEEEAAQAIEDEVGRVADAYIDDGVPEAVARKVASRILGAAS